MLKYIVFLVLSSWSIITFGQTCQTQEAQANAEGQSLVSSQNNAHNACIRAGYGEQCGAINPSFTLQYQTVNNQRSVRYSFTQFGAPSTGSVPEFANGDWHACTAPPPDPTGPGSPIQNCKDSQTIYNSTIGERYTAVEMPGSISSGSSVCVPSSYGGGSTSCTMNFERDITYQDASGDWISRGQLDMGGMSGSYVSLPCGQTTTPDIPPVKPENINPPCPPGEQQGTINGSVVCKPFGPDVKTVTKDSVKQSTDSAGNQTVTETSTECQGDKCTTTTETKNSQGASQGKDQTTTTKDSFCSKNPSSPQCGGSAGGGSNKDGCVSGANTVGCSKFGTPAEAEPISNVDVPLTFAREAGFGASDSSCPAPRVMNIPGGGTVSMSFDMYCDFARGMRPFIIGFALLSAAGMVLFSATRKG